MLRFDLKLLFYFYFLAFVFLGPHLRHMEVPRLGVELKLQLLAHATAIAMQDPSCICDPHHSSWQCQILNPLSEARDGTHNLMIPSQIHFHCTTMGMPQSISLRDTLFLAFVFFRAAPVAYGGSQDQGSSRSYSCWPKPQPQQHQIRAASETYTTAHGNARSLTH